MQKYWVLNIECWRRKKRINAWRMMINLWMMRLAINISFQINPEDLQVYSNMIGMGNTTPAGVEHPADIVHFYKHSMPPASLLPPKNRGRLLTSFYGKETSCLTPGLQPHLLWLKPVTFMKSANRQLNQTAIKQTEFRKEWWGKTGNAKIVWHEKI